MSQINVNSEFVLGLLDEIGRTRALADHETDVIEAIVMCGHRSTGLRMKWTAVLDRRLLKAASTRGGIKAFATSQGLAQWAAYKRLQKLREGKLLAKAGSGRVGV